MADEQIKPSPVFSGAAPAPPGPSPLVPGPPPAAASQAITPDLPHTRTSEPHGLSKKRPPQEYKDGTREVVETVVFVVVLVLLLKTFLAEAFVIPTGSMATTLLGYHKEVKCEQCDFFPVRINVSSMVDPDEGLPREVPGGHCPNCDYYNRINLLKREEQP